MRRTEFSPRQTRTPSRWEKFPPLRCLCWPGSMSWLSLFVKYGIDEHLHGEHSAGETAYDTVSHTASRSLFAACSAGGPA
ncbi:hypothetical protein BDW62DRAFT_181179 [Aspergillus aurantiobrunneus]